MSKDKENNISLSQSYTFPLLVYGTADFGTGKSDQLSAAVSLGYRFVDTGNNDPYDEAKAGVILASEFGVDGRCPAVYDNFISEPSATKIRREQIVIQAKYSPPSFFRKKQPPYGLTDTVPLQIIKSFQATLLNLRISYVDVYFLHRPFRADSVTFAAWEVMEEICRQGGARCLGISQVDLTLLQTLVQKADIPPKFVQNYCCKSNEYDRDVRKYCRDHDIVYQCFGLLAEVTDPAWGRKENEEISGLAACLVAARQCGERFCVLDGSRDLNHMAENMKAVGIVQAGYKYEQHPNIENFSL